MLAWKASRGEVLPRADGVVRALERVLGDATLGGPVERLAVFDAALQLLSAGASDEQLREAAELAEAAVGRFEE